MRARWADAGDDRNKQYEMSQCQRAEIAICLHLTIKFSSVCPPELSLSLSLSLSVSLSYLSLSLSL